MPANKYALIRYRVIDRCLTNKGRPYPSRETLRQECEKALFGSGGSRISLSTIDKDLWAMKNEGELGYHAPIAYHREHGGYYYTDPEYSISELSLGDDDLEALYFAAAILRQFRDLPVLEQYQNAVDKITSRVNIAADTEDKHLEKYIQFEKSTVSGGYEYLGDLLSSIREKKVCTIDYQGYRDERRKPYTIHPLFLKEYSNRWYLIAEVPDRKSLLTFGLERIRQLEVTERPFEPGQNFDPERFFRYSIGITESRDNPVSVELSCEPVAGRLLLSQPVHFSQRLISEDDHRIRIGLEVIPTRELIALILSYGSEIEVISPPELRQKIREELQKAQHGYLRSAD